MCSSDLFLMGSLIDIDHDIRQTVLDDDRLSGMGTTLTAIALYRDRAYVLHAGD